MSRWEDRRRTIEASERAAVARWFSPSPLGLLYHGDDGTARPIAPDLAERYQREAMAPMQALLDEEMAHVWLSGLIGIATAVIVWCMADLFAFSRAGALPAGVMTAMSFAHFYPMLRVWQIRQTHKALRARISESLRATAPVPASIASQYRRKNPFKPALELIVGAVVLLAAFAMHDERLITMIPAWIYLAVVPVAWLLFAISKYRDAQQARADRQPRER